MKNLVFFSFISIFSAFPVMVNAVDIPSVIEGADGYNQEECVAASTNDCIQSICETSSDLNCEDQCRGSAVDRCKEINE